MSGCRNARTIVQGGGGSAGEKPAGPGRLLLPDDTLENIGARLGLSKSWVSRLHAKSLEMVRQALEKDGIHGIVPVSNFCRQAAISKAIWRT